MIPRLLERWPPLRLTAWKILARISEASCSRPFMSNPRRSAGDRMVARIEGAGGAESGIDGSSLGRGTKRSGQSEGHPTPQSPEMLEDRAASEVVKRMKARAVCAGFHEARKRNSLFAGG